MASQHEPRRIDVPLDTSGEIELPGDLARLADQLRSDAARIAERAVPQAAAAPLWAQHRKQRQASWRRAAVVFLGGMAVSAAALLAATQVEWRPADAPPAVSPTQRDHVLGTDTTGSSADTALAAHSNPPGAEVSVHELARASARDVFLSADSPAGANGALAVELATPDEKIRMLEDAVERYRSAVAYQQEQLLEAQQRLAAAEREIRQLRAQLSSAAPD